MTDDEIKALVSEQVGTALTTKLEAFDATITKRIHDANAGVATSLNKAIQKLGEKVAKPEAKPEPTPEGKPEGDGMSLQVKALQDQLAKVKGDFETSQATAKKAQASNALTSAIATSGAQNQTALATILDARLGSQLSEEGGNWFVTDGTTTTPLGTAVTDYLKTDEGKHFVPASTVKGSGSKETKPGTSSSSNTKPSSLDAAFAEGFAEI